MRLKTLSELCINQLIADGRNDDIYKMKLFTSFKMVETNMSKEYQKLVHSQNITKLELPYFDHYAHQFFTERKDGEFAPAELQDEFLLVNINGTLKAYLNRESQRSLQKLAINCQFVCLQPGWSREMTAMFPSLTDLDLRYDCLTNGDFFIICFYLRNLQKLRIRGSSRIYINCIEFLQNLEVLDIAGMEITDQKNIEGLFHLQKLRVLDISKGDSPTLTLFPLFCQFLEPLRNLQMLDLSYNVLNEEQLKDVIYVHHNLKMISLIGTELETSELKIAWNPDLKYLTVANQESCIESLDYYTTPFSGPQVVHILNVIITRYKKKHTRDTVKALDRCFSSCLNLLDNEEMDIQKRIDVMESLELLCRNKRHFQYSRADMNKLYVGVKETIDRIRIHRNGMRNNSTLLFIILNLLKEIMTSNPSQSDIDYFCEKSMKFVRQVVSSNPITLSCISFFAQFASSMSPEKLEQISQDGHYLIPLMRIRGRNGLPNDVLLEIMQVLFFMNKGNRINKETVNKYLIKYFMLKLKAMRANRKEEEVLKMLEMLKDYLSDLSITELNEITEDYTNSVFLPLLNFCNENKDIREVAVFILYTAYARINGVFKNELEHSRIESDKAVTEIMATFELKRYKFKLARKPDQFAETLKSSMTTPDSHSWALWMAEKIIKNE